MISRATSSVSRLNDSRFSNVMRRVEAFAMPSFPRVRNFFVLRVFPREREIFFPRTATLSVKHLVGDVSFLQDSANQEPARSKGHTHLKSFVFFRCGTDFDGRRAAGHHQIPIELAGNIDGANNSSHASFRSGAKPESKGPLTQRVSSLWKPLVQT